MDAKAKQQALDEAIRAVIAMPDGRRVLQWILSMCAVARPLYGDSQEMVYREGRRSIGIAVRDRITKLAGARRLVDIEEQDNNG